MCSPFGFGCVLQSGWRAPGMTKKKAGLNLQRFSIKRRHIAKSCSFYKKNYNYTPIYIYIPFFSPMQKSQAFISLIRHRGGWDDRHCCGRHKFTPFPCSLPLYQYHVHKNILSPFIFLLKHFWTQSWIVIKKSLFSRCM